MADLIQQVGFRLLRKAIVAVWSLTVLAVLLGVGYFLGRQWGETQGEPNGMWFGLLGGFLVWSVVGRRRRRRRRGWSGGSSSSYDDGGGGGWFDGDGDGGDGGGDD